MVPATALLLAAAACGGAERGARTVPRAVALATPRSIRTATASGGDLAAADDSSAGALTETRFRNVNFHVAPGVVLEIRRLRGQMVSKTRGKPVVFDDKQSFVIRIDSAIVALDTTSLDHLMNEHVFAYKGAPLRHLSFATNGDELVQRGILHKVVDLPFQLTARVSVTPQGLLRMHPTAMKISWLNTRGIMHALGLKLSGLLDLEQAKGVRVDGDDLLLDPEQLLPPPAITGRVTAVHVEPGRLVQVFGGNAGTRRAHESPPAALVPPDSLAPNYMYFRHGTLRFGKLSMVRADMQIVDLDPSDPFDFSIDRYNEQIVAGYSKNRSNMGIEVFMPDLWRIDQRTARPAHP